MLETLRQVPFFRNRHLEAPLLNEREMFLRHLQQQGTSRAALLSLSNELLHVTRLLRLNRMRDVSLEEIRHAADRFVREEQSNPRARSYRCTGGFFIYAAKKWLRFHGRFRMPSPPPVPFAEQLDQFARYMREEQGLSSYSVDSHCSKTSMFLGWIGKRGRSLATMTVEDVDDCRSPSPPESWSGVMALLRIPLRLLDIPRISRIVGTDLSCASCRSALLSDALVAPDLSLE